MSQLVRPACRCRRPLKMGSAPNCGYCGGKIPAAGFPKVPAAIIARGRDVDIYDATRHPDVDEMPAQTTFMDATQFQDWIASPGKIYIVYLPGQKSFVVKVTDQHHDFFIAIIKQLRMQLGGEVQAAAAVAVDPSTTTVPLSDSDFPGVTIAPPQTTAAVHDDPPPHQQRFTTCPGSGLTPVPGTVRADETVGINERGECQCCGRDYQLTAGGVIRLHRTHGGGDER